MNERKEYFKQYYIKNKEKIAKRNKKWKEKNKEKRKKYMREYNKKNNNTDISKKAKKKWRDENMDKVREQKKRSYLKNKESYIKRNSEYAKQNKIKHNAHNAVGRAIARGDIIKPTICDNGCENDCRIEAHHDDYSKPLIVKWLCAKCHRNLHEKNKNTMHKTKRKCSLQI